jgi:hypothetical protein
MQHQRQKPEFYTPKHNYRAGVLLWQEAEGAVSSPKRDCYASGCAAANLALVDSIISEKCFTLKIMGERNGRSART